MKISEKMNVLLIITDQQRKDHLHCYGNEIIKTPNIDSIFLEGGVAFTNYFCNTPICMPNRACMFTGVLPSVHGTRSNGINLNPDIPVISEILRKNGYHTASVGKIHFNFLGRSASRKVKSVEDFLGWFHGDNTSENFPLPYYGFDEVYLAAGHGDFMGGHYFEWLKEKGWDHRVTDIENFIEEGIDVLIQTLELLKGLGANIDEQLRKKMEYNRNRPPRHGGKRI